MGESGSNDPNTYVLIIHMGAGINFYQASPEKIATKFILRPEFKFPAKSEMASSQILAITS